MKDSYKTDIIFRKARYEDGSTEILAIFPDAIERGEVMCYAHIGQHGYASLAFYHENTKKLLRASIKSFLRNWKI